MRRRIAPLAAALLLAAVGAGCVRMPESGPVVETRSEGDVTSSSGIYVNPKPPVPGDTRTEIVRGFLVAMTATPIRTDIAREFLTQDAAASWAPERQTITYAGRTTPRETQDGVSVTLSGPAGLDSRGAWRGDLPGADHTLTFPMSFENGEWRIDRAPDALVVPETWFEQRYRQVSLYFFDPTASILAPEPVFVESGSALATTLVQGLLRGPGSGLGKVAQSFVPAGLRVAVGVAVSDDGLADIQLNGDTGELTPKTIELMMAQFAWTLAQVPEIESLRVSINGDPVPLPGGVSTYRVDGGAEYDPAGRQASPLLYGIRDGRLVSGPPNALEPVQGPMGQHDYALRSLGVDLAARRVAGVTSGGGSVLVGPLSQTDDGRVHTLMEGGTDFLRPAWDFSDRLWLVDRTADGARVWYVEGDRVSPLRIPGITGEPVTMFLVSRDGTRMVAAVRHPGGDVLVVSRIEHSGTGRVLGATSARRISAGSETELPIRALAWRSSTSVAVLKPFTPALAEIAVASVDGSPSGLDTSSATVESRLLGLAGSPADDEASYGFTTDGLVDLTSPDRQVTPLEKGTRAIVYVG